MNTTTLYLEDLQAADEAAHQFTEVHGDCGMSHEMLMLFCFIKENSATPAPAQAQRWTIGSPAARATHPAPAQSIPDWFTEGVKQFAGQKVTASTIMTELGRPTAIGALREAGSWLRQLYGEPLRSGGQTLFIIAGAQKAHQERLAGAQQDDDAPDENPYSKDLPIFTRVKNFTARTQSGKYTVQKIANLMGMQGTSKELVEIGKALTHFSYRYWPEENAFDLSLPT